MKWEYIHFYFEYYKGYSMDKLNNLGKDGWEICCKLSEDLITNSARLLLKRQIKI